MASACELCTPQGETILWTSSCCRVIRVHEPAFPGFCRVIWHEHVREMSDLSADQQRVLMDVVFSVEAALRVCYQPDKINLASFGNVVPHLHWHVIPRWRDDSHFPEPIWGKLQRDAVAERRDVDNERLTGEIIRQQAARENRHE